MKRTIEIETDCAAFLASIENWNGTTPAFSDVVSTAIWQAFRCFRTEEFRRRLVAKVECGGWTVAQYATGAAMPHHGVQKRVVREIAALIKELDAEYREERGRMIAFMRGVGGGGED